MSITGFPDDFLVDSAVIIERSSQKEDWNRAISLRRVLKSKSRLNHTLCP